MIKVVNDHYTLILNNGFLHLHLLLLLLPSHNNKNKNMHNNSMRKIEQFMLFCI